eukprot:7580033-Pyramimonas_sp.AAC.1
MPETKERRRRDKSLGPPGSNERALRAFEAPGEFCQNEPHEPRCSYLDLARSTSTSAVSLLAHALPLTRCSRTASSSSGSSRGRLCLPSLSASRGTPPPLSRFGLLLLLSERMLIKPLQVHWPHSAAGACGTPNQYQTPFYDGTHTPQAPRRESACASNFWTL